MYAFALRFTSLLTKVSVSMYWSNSQRRARISLLPSNHAESMNTLFRSVLLKQMFSERYPPHRQTDGKPSSLVDLLQLPPPQSKTLSTHRIRLPIPFLQLQNSMQSLQNPCTNIIYDRTCSSLVQPGEPTLHHDRNEYSHRSDLTKCPLAVGILVARMLRDCSLETPEPERSPQLSDCDGGNSHKQGHWNPSLQTCKLRQLLLDVSNHLRLSMLSAQCSPNYAE